MFAWQVKKYCILNCRRFSPCPPSFFFYISRWCYYALRACIVLAAGSYQVTFTALEYILGSRSPRGRTNPRVRYHLDYLLKETFGDSAGKWDKNKSGERKQEDQRADNKKPSFKSWDDRGGVPNGPADFGAKNRIFSRKVKGGRWNQEMWKRSGLLIHGNGFCKWN